MTDYCIHIANLFYLASFAAKDMLWLRILTCAGLVFGIVFFNYCPKEPMYGPMFWHFVFLGINAYRIVALIRERGWSMTRQPTAPLDGNPTAAAAS